MSQIDIERDLDRHEMIRGTARQFADREIRPIAAELDESERFPAELYDRMAELGLFGITVPAELGGAGADAVAYAIVMEELSRGYASVADQCGLVELVGTLLSRTARRSSSERYLRPLLAAKRRCAYAITEAEAGSDVSGIKTTATRDRRWLAAQRRQALDPQRAGRATSPSCWPAPTRTPAIAA